MRAGMRSQARRTKHAEDPASTQDVASSRATKHAGAQHAANPIVLPPLPPEWEAYRDVVLTRAAAAPDTLAPGDPRTAVPDVLRPGTHRVHPAYWWAGALKTGLAVILAIAVSLLGSLIGLLTEGQASSVTPSEAVLITLAVVVPTLLIFGGLLLFFWLSWKHLSYELAPAELNVRLGILNKKRKHVPYQRVQAVNQQAGILQRLLGLCTVKIDNAGGAANDAIVLGYVRNSDAEALRSELFRRKGILLAGGVLDEYGNAFFNGAVVPSVWTIACANGDEQAARIVLGGMDATWQEPASRGANSQTASTPGTRPFPNQAQQEGNVLDAIDDALLDVRGVFGGHTVGTGAVSYETGLSNKELLLAGISGSGGALGAIAVAVLGVLGSVMSIFEQSMESWLETAVEGAASSVISGAAGNMISSAIWGLVPWVVALMLFLWAVSAAGAAVHYGGFKVRRRENRIEVEYGLLQRSFHGVDIDRVQSVVIEQSFIRRCIGYCELSLGKIDSVAESNSGKQNGNQAVARGMVVHPFVKLNRVPEILQGIAPELASFPPIQQAPAPVALRRAVFRRSVLRSVWFWCMGLLVCVLACVFVFMPAQVWAEAGAMPEYAFLRALLIACVALLVVGMGVNLAGAVLWFRNSGLGCSRDALRITNGGLSQKTVLVPRKKIQFASTRTNPFQRGAHVQTIMVRTAAGIGGSTETLWDLSDADADTFMEWVRPRHVVTTRSSHSTALTTDASEPQQI